MSSTFCQIQTFIAIFHKTIFIFKFANAKYVKDGSHESQECGPVASLNEVVSSVYASLHRLITCYWDAWLMSNIFLLSPWKLKCPIKRPCSMVLLPDIAPHDCEKIVWICRAGLFFIYSAVVYCCGKSFENQSQTQSKVHWHKINIVSFLFFRISEASETNVGFREVAHNPKHT